MQIKPYFPGAKNGLRQFLPRFNLGAPVSLRTLAANAAIATRYDQMGGYKGPLGFSLSGVFADSPATFDRRFCGGNVRFQGDGSVQMKLYKGTVTYRGIHCFGNPKGLASNSVYLIVSVYPPGNPGKAEVFKIPDDSGGSVIEGLDQGQDSNNGERVVYGDDAFGYAPPTSLIITTMVMGTSLLGDSQKVKQKVKDAVQQSADQLNAAEGQPATPAQVALFSDTLTGIIVPFLGAIGLTDAVRGRPMAISLTVNDQQNDFAAAPPPSSLHRGPIAYNFETPILTDGDASYKAYFDVVYETRAGQ
jgi:hypothetical protein